MAPHWHLPRTIRRERTCSWKPSKLAEDGLALEDEASRACNKNSQTEHGLRRSSIARIATLGCCCIWPGAQSSGTSRLYRKDMGCARLARTPTGHAAASYLTWTTGRPQPTGHGVRAAGAHPIFRAVPIPCHKVGILVNPGRCDAVHTGKSHLQTQPRTNSNRRRMQANVHCCDLFCARLLRRACCC